MKRKYIFYKKIFILIIIKSAVPLVIATSANASTDTIKDNSNTCKRYALQFGIIQHCGIPELDYFEFGKISFKRQISPRSSLRLGLSIYSFYREFDFETCEWINDSISMSDSDYYKEGTSSWSVTTEYQYYLMNNEKIVPYIGCGLIGYISSHLDWTCGLSSVFGAEWFANKNFGLFAEYDISFSYSYREVNYESPFFEDSHKIRRLTLGNDNLKLGLSVYF